MLPTIHMFWHGAALSRVERLCMTSFIACGHTVDLYVYEEPHRVPIGVRLADAGRIIPRDQMFRHSRSGSLAPFTDWFRYRVVLAQGGVWADTDVVCLRPLSYPRPEIFAWQDDMEINGAVFGLPTGHPLAEWMADCCEHPHRPLPYDSTRRKLVKPLRWLLGNRRGNVQWGEYGPTGFTSAARHFGFVDLALPAQHFYAVPYGRWRSVFNGKDRDWDSLLAESRALHLWNEMMRREPGFDKNARFAETSLFERLCAQYLPDDG